jgi:polysaccharide export outer membrane protein
MRISGFARLLLVGLVTWIGLAAAPVSFAQTTGYGFVPGDREYHINPEDVLEISVWREEDLRREVLVRPDGGISFPLAGNVEVAGRTVEQVRDELTRRIGEYIPDAVVSVAVVRVAGYQVYVLGKVNSPGQYTVGRYLDVMQALTLAGGLTPFANEDDISIIRRTASGEEVYEFDYSAIKRGRELDQNILLQSGDVVVVP